MARALMKPPLVYHNDGRSSRDHACDLSYGRTTVFRKSLIKTNLGLESLSSRREILCLCILHKVFYSTTLKCTYYAPLLTSLQELIIPARLLAPNVAHKLIKMLF